MISLSDLTATREKQIPLIQKNNNTRTMQKILIVAVTMMISLASIAQKEIVWFDIGLKTQYGATGMYNSAIADSDEVDYIISKGYGLGGKLGINFGFNGLAIDFMASTGTQEFDNVMDNENANPKVDYKSLDLYLLFRNARNLGYFEIGPKFSFVRDVEFTDELGATADVKDDFNSNYISGVIGFGANVMGTYGAFSGILGLRFEYGFTDAVSNAGAETSAPIYNPAVFTEGLKSTKPIFAGVVFELNWGVGAFAVAKCGGRPKFIMF